MKYFFLPLISSIIGSLIIAPLLLHLSKKYPLAIAKPGGRKIHNQPIPQLGGVIIYFSFLISFLLFAPKSEKLLALMLGLTFIFIVGFVDDLKELSAKLKLFLQIIAATFIVLVGIKIQYVTNPAGGIGSMFYLAQAGAIITIIWIVVITNAINLIDGLDGLCTGTTLIACSLFLALAYWERPTQAYIVILLGAVMGALIGFLPYNFFPAKIFLGDSGAYFLGFFLATISILGAFKSVFALSIFFPILVLGVPLFDTFFSIFRRLKKGTTPFTADKEHLHHRLMDAGLSHKQTVIFIYLLNSLLGLIALLIVRAK